MTYKVRPSEGLPVPSLATRGASATAVNLAAETAARIAADAALDSDKQDISEKGVTSGYAGLDGGGTVPLAQLPAYPIVGGVSYRGLWNATTNTPTIPAASSGNRGFFYEVSVAGSTTIDGISSWGVGDFIVSNGATWEKLTGQGISSDSDSITVNSQKHIIRRDLKNLGAVEGDDDAHIAANQAAVDAAIATGKVYTCQPGSLYKFGEGFVLPSNVGFEVPGSSFAEFLMATGTGYFDKVVFGDFEDPEYTLFQCVAEATGIVLDGIDIRLDANAAIRVARAVDFRKARDLQVARLRVREFKESSGGICELHSCTGGRFTVEGYDPDFDTDTLVGAQLTLLAIDDNNYPDLITSGMVLEATGYNWHLGDTARAEYSEQSDIINLQSFDVVDYTDPTPEFVEGNNLVLARSVGGGVGEVLDIWGCGNKCVVQWEDCRSVPVKVIFGASKNVIDATGSGTGLSAVYLAAGAHVSRPRPCRQNIININATKVGSRYSEYYLGVGQGMHGGIQIEGQLAPLLADRPHGNIIRGRVEGDGTALGYAVAAAYSGVNDIEIACDSFQTAFAINHEGDANGRLQRIRRLGRTPARVRAYYASVSSTVAHQVRIPYTTEVIDDTLSYGAGTPTFTAPVTGFYQVSGVVVVDIPNGKYAGIQFDLGEGDPRVGPRKLNNSGSTLNEFLTFSEEIYMTGGQALAVLLSTDQSGGLTVYGNTTDPRMTRLSIVEVAEHHPSN